MEWLGEAGGVAQRWLIALGGVEGAIALALLLSVMMVAPGRRMLMAGIVLQSLLLAAVAARYSPVGWAAIRLLTGICVAAMWWLSALMVRWGDRGLPWASWRWPPLSARALLRLTLLSFAAFILLVARLWLPLPDGAAPLSPLVTWMLAVALLSLALTDEPLLAGVALLWGLEAFHLVWSALGYDALGEGVLGILKLALGVAIAYLIIVSGVRWRRLREVEQ